MTGRDRFLGAVPELVEQARGRNLRIGIAIRQALMDLKHYECPIGLHAEGAWVFVIGEKLESPNKFRAHWSLQNGSRARWEKHMRDVVADALGVSSWGCVLELGRKPAVTVKMTLQIVRLVASSREFIRDDDNLAFSRKGATDAMKRTGLLKEDRREWLEALPIHQDVSPNGKSMTVFFLWPAEPGLFQEPADVRIPRPHASRQGVDDHRSPQRQNHPRRGVRAQPRTADPETRS